MLCSLVPEDYEEAITLVPSLRDRFERGQVESIIDKLEQNASHVVSLNFSLSTHHFVFLGVHESFV